MQIPTIHLSHWAHAPNTKWKSIFIFTRVVQRTIYAKAHLILYLPSVVHTIKVNDLAFFCAPSNCPGALINFVDVAKLCGFYFLFRVVFFFSSQRNNYWKCILSWIIFLCSVRIASVWFFNCWENIFLHKNHMIKENFHISRQKKY